MPTATSSSTIPEEPPSASTPKLHLHYVTVSGDSTPRRPNLINNLLDLSTKARLGGRRGIKRKALLYAGPDIDDVEQDIMVNNDQILFLELPLKSIENRIKSWTDSNSNFLIEKSKYLFSSFILNVFFGKKMIL